MNTSVNQKAFDQSFLNVLKQGKPSYSTRSKGCEYKISDDLKCAAGWLFADNVTDEQYNNIEGADWPYVCSQLNVETILDKKYVLASRELIQQLQIAHDSWAECEDDHDLWQDSIWQRFEDAAKEFGLKMPFPKTSFKNMQQKAIKILEVTA